MLDDEMGQGSPESISIVVLGVVPPIRKKISVLVGGTEHLRFGFVRPGHL